MADRGPTLPIDLSTLYPQTRALNLSPGATISNQRSARTSGAVGGSPVRTRLVERAREGDESAFYAIVGVMVVMMIGMIAFFRRRGWL